MAQLADESLLPAQAAAQDVRAGKLDHLGQEGGQFPIDHLQGRGGGGAEGGAELFASNPPRMCSSDLDNDAQTSSGFRPGVWI